MRSLLLTQSYDATPDELTAALMDPALDAFMAEHVPDLKERVGIERKTEGNLVINRVRCTPHERVIPEVAKGRVNPEMIVWEEETRMEVGSGVIRFKITPNGFRSVFKFSGSMRITPTPDGHSQRRVEGELSIGIPVLGRFVEDYMLGEIQRNLEAEADALSLFLAERRRSG